MNKREKITKFCEIILNHLEFRSWDKAKKEDGLSIPYEHYSISIPYEHFKKEGLDNFDVFDIFIFLENKNILHEGHVTVHSSINAKPLKKQEELDIKETAKYLNNNLVFTIYSLKELKKIYKKQKLESNINKIESLTLPRDTKWEDITLKFINDFDVKISIKNKNYNSNYKKMGFADKRRKDKTVAIASWKLLTQLAISNGNYSLNKLKNKEIKQIKKQKQDLSKKLKSFFNNIPEDPFYEYNYNNRYKIKIKLIPIKEFRKDYRDRYIFDENNKFYDLDYNYNKQINKTNHKIN